MREKVLITGATTKISTELQGMLGEEFDIIAPNSQEWDLSSLGAIRSKKELILSCNRIVLLHSVIGTERFLGRSEEDLVKSFNVNLLSYIEICETALNENPHARIALMGSESGLKGSFDIAYGLSKSALHKYVEERRIVHSDQQIVCLAPSTIVDAGITVRRSDQDNVKKSIDNNPKKRGLTSSEVAKVIHFLLFEEAGYLTNTVIHLNGGKFSRM